MRKASAFAAIFCAVIFLVSCRSESESSKTARDVLDAVFETQSDFPEHSVIYSLDESGAQREGWEDEFEILFDFDAEKVSDYAIVYSSALTADEIAVVKLDSSSDANDFESAAQAHIENRLRDFRNYGPDETAKLENAIIDVSGSFCIVIVSEQASEAQDAFKNAL